jgi:hypothetical protein
MGLMLEAACICETSVNFYQTKRRSIPHDSHLQPLFFFMVNTENNQYGSDEA